MQTKSKEISSPTMIKPKRSRSMWSLYYRLHGLTIALAAVAAFCYFYLHYWHTQLLIAGAIFGYFLGWVVGSWTYKED